MIDKATEARQEYLASWVMYINYAVLMPLLPGFVVAVRTEKVWQGVLAFLAANLYAMTSLYLFNRTRPVRGGR
jgi:hypothetical protein